MPNRFIAYPHNRYLNHASYKIALKTKKSINP